MTETELQAIEARRQCCLGTGRTKDTEASLADIPALCAEVRKLRAYLEATAEGFEKCGLDASAKHLRNVLEAP